MSVGQEHVDFREALRNLDESKHKLRERDAELAAERAKSVRLAPKTEGYPMWCIDRGENFEEPYMGPYETLDQVSSAGWSQGQVRRCRRIRPSEVLSAVHWAREAEEIAEQMSDVVIDGLGAVAWGNWGEQLVQLRDPVAAGVALAHWLDEHATVALYVCQGDESAPAPVAPARDEDLATELGKIEADAVAGYQEVEKLLAEISDLRLELLAALNACESWRRSYEDVCGEAESMRGRMRGGGPQALAIVGWELALWMGETTGVVAGDFTEDDFVFGDGSRFGVKDTLDTIVAASYRMSRAEGLLEQARFQAGRFKRQRDEAIRREAETSRRLADALVRIEELEAGAQASEP